MSELILPNKVRNREYGDYYKGYVKTEEVEDGRTRERRINIALREPAGKGSDPGTVYVNAHGWLVPPKLSMRVPAIEAAKNGFSAVTLEPTNKRVGDPLAKNARDLASVITALSDKGYRQRVLALSMGGRVATQALVEVGSKVDSATLVAPAGYFNRDPSIVETGQHLLKTLPELGKMAARNPKQSAYLGAKTVHHCVTRGPAIAAEISEVIRGNEYEALNEIKSQPNPPRMQLFYGSNDRLLPAWAFEMSTPDLPLDHVEMYEGGHTALVNNPQLSQRIYELDQAQAARPPLAA